MHEEEINASIEMKDDEESLGHTEQYEQLFDNEKQKGKVRFKDSSFFHKVRTMIKEGKKQARVSFPNKGSTIYEDLALESINDLEKQPVEISLNNDLYLRSKYSA
mmetsp:Transcript_40853/g.39439  ORF Transcript_40853/g.39439 Transcript_40853/m.39439 type:complete len:105 (+) Transcript_40853:607-921(+)|eukprot:CAMPEP_0170544970 /NCGR_PEP_ID=MMETSP0211-20121228/3535_1 /TAXON_ID=311385 /ORGANISM="Pseudokeronopsis sp., Strain OXSARD2" /LENGTH=104 /DNA_ID=CAMNT_0010848757 /DNA_START=683 /DNA_END=997 /DNA_ORIENTATION=-